MMSPLRYVGLALISAIPTLSMLFFMLLQFLPYHVPHFQAVVPHLFLATAFYWSLHRPDVTPEWLLFALGLVYDFLAGGIIGFTAFALVVMARYTLNQRRVLAGRLFVLSWLGFIIVAFVYGVLYWLLASIVHAGQMNVVMAALQTLMTMCAYPVVARILGTLHRMVIG
jgi:rod shape-determining protein MreD